MLALYRLPTQSLRLKTADRNKRPRVLDFRLADRKCFSAPLLIVENDLRDSFVDLKLRTHLLDLCGLLVEPCSGLRNCWAELLFYLPNSACFFVLFGVFLKKPLEPLHSTLWAPD